MWVKRGRRIFAHSFQPAASPKALTHISREIRSHFYKTQLRPTKRIDAYLIRWSRRKFRRLRHQTKGAREWFDRLRRANPTLFAHWSAEERAPAAELVTKARRLMDVSFTLNMFASIKIFLDDGAQYQPRSRTRGHTKQVFGSSMGWGERSYQPEPLGARSAIGQRFPEAAINLARGELDSLNFRKRPRGSYQ